MVVPSVLHGRQIPTLAQNPVGHCALLVQVRTCSFKTQICAPPTSSTHVLSATQPVPVPTVHEPDTGGTPPEKIWLLVIAELVPAGWHLAKQAALLLLLFFPLPPRFLLPRILHFCSHVFAFFFPPLFLPPPFFFASASSALKPPMPSVARTAASAPPASRASSDRLEDPASADATNVWNRFASNAHLLVPPEVRAPVRGMNLAGALR
jgi:hypothetical protein